MTKSGNTNSLYKSEWVLKIKFALAKSDGPSSTLQFQSENFPDVPAENMVFGVDRLQARVWFYPIDFWFASNL